VNGAPWQLDARALLDGYRQGTLSPVEVERVTEALLYWVVPPEVVTSML